MKKQQAILAIGLIVVLLIAVSIVITYEHYGITNQKINGSSTDSFFLEPVVDVIIPRLFNNGVNSPLNLTKGGTTSLLVEIFPLLNLKAGINATVTSLFDPGENLSGHISTNFNPTQLSIANGSSGNTTLNISASENTQSGIYSVTVTATNLENSSQYWGALFQLNVVG